MKTKTNLFFASALAVLGLGILTSQATVTMEFTLGDVPSLNSGAVGIIVADANDDGFTDLALANAVGTQLTVGQTLGNSDDVIVGVIQADNVPWGGGVGFSDTLAAIDYSALGIAEGTKLIFYWFPDVTTPGSSLMAGTTFFSFRSDTADASGGDIPFEAPADRGVYVLAQVTTPLGGDFSPPTMSTEAGSIGTDTAVEEPTEEATDPATTDENWIIEAQGKYSGLLLDPSNPNNVLGFIQQVSVKHDKKTGDSAVVTIKLTFGGKPITLKGVIRPDGTFGRIDPVDGFVQSFFQKDGAELVTTLKLVSTLDGYKIVGGIDISGGADGMIDSLANISRAAFNGKTVVFDGAGPYTMIIPSEDPLPAGSPGGHGIGSVKTDTRGRFQAKVVLGDGQKATLKGTVSKDNEVQIFTSLYKSKPKGKIAGILTFRDEMESDFDGMLAWEKLENAKEKTYKDGFDIEIGAVGSKFVAPDKKAGEMLLSTIAAPTPKSAELNSIISFLGDANPLEVPFRVTQMDPGGKITIPSEVDKNGKTKVVLDKSFRAAISTKTGLGKGTVKYPVTQTVNGKEKTKLVTLKYDIAVLQKQEVAAGVLVNGEETGAVIIESN